MAADIANAFCAHLDRLNKGYALASTRRMRRFLELRLVEKSQKLDEAESRLKDFQTDNKIIATAEQTEGAMTAVAELHSQIIAYEVELAALKEYATPHHPMINHLQAQIEESRRQLDKLDQDKALGIVSKRAPLSKKVFPAYGEAPTLALEMLRLARKVKVEEAVYGMLIGQLESVKMTEARDLPTIQVMDPAVPPTYSVYPKTLQNALASGALALILGVFLAYVLQYIEHLKVSAIGSSHPSTSLVGDTNGNGKCDQQDPLPAREMQHPLE
jgi:capsule polysaccharide export protein KpsE/RkpR